MLPIVSNPEEITMNSIDFLNEIINPARIYAGEKETRYTDFIKRVIDELDLSQNEIFVLDNKGKGRNQHYAVLNYDQMILVGMRESKAVRKSVLAKLKELSDQVEKKAVQLPDFSNPAEAARAWAEQFERAAIAEKTKAQINDKRTATLMNKASQDAKRIKKLESQLQDVGEYQSIVAAKLPQRIDTEVRNNVQSWRILKEISSDRQLPPKKVKCQRYGEVLAYHIDVIEIFKDKYM
jgi:vacuolar-type H+-ATPase subunit I/STV1